MIKNKVNDFFYYNRLPKYIDTTCEPFRRIYTWGSTGFYLKRPVEYKNDNLYISYIIKNIYKRNKKKYRLPLLSLNPGLFIVVPPSVSPKGFVGSPPDLRENNVSYNDIMNKAEFITIATICK